MRDDEIAGKIALESHLSNFIGIPSQEWRDGNQNTPPDFYLTIDDTEYVVEVTQIDENVKTPRGILPRRTISSHLKDFLVKIEEEAGSILKGTYYVSFVMRDDFGDNKAAIKKAILNKLNDTQYLKAGGPWPITVENSYGFEIVHCSITKTPKPGSSLTMGPGPTQSKFIESAKKDLEYLLIDKINRKARKLVKFRQPKILILLNWYGFLDSDHYKMLRQYKSVTEQFHSIFVAGRSGSYMITSQNPGWFCSDK